MLLRVVHGYFISFDRIQYLFLWKGLRKFTLGGTVSQAAGLFGSGWTGCPVDTVELTVLPAPNSQQEAEDITLLLAVQLLHVFVGPHLKVKCMNQLAHPKVQKVI